MLPFYLMAFLPLMTCVISPKYRLTMNKKTLSETRTLPMDLFMFLFLLLLALRGIDCGADTIQYERLFNEYGRLSIERIFHTFDHELGFKLLCKLIYVLTADIHIMLAVTAFACVLPLWSFYRRHSEIQPLTIALFLTIAPFVMYFSGIRQAMAMSIGFYAWNAAREKRLFRFAFLVFLAMQFHNSAFMLIPLYPLYHARITKNWLWFVVPGMLAVFVYRTAIFSILITFLWQEYETTPETGATTILLLLCMFAVYSYVIPDEKLLDQETIALRNILLLSVVIQIFAMLHPLSMRMNYYYLVFVPILIPKIANRSKPGLSQIARLSVVVMTVYFIYYFFVNGINDNDDLNIFPYIPYWQS